MIEPQVFVESANLSSLFYIDLSYNDLTELEPWPLIRAQHRIMIVNLRSNRISNFTNALGWSFDCNSTGIFNTILNLADNRVKHVNDAIDPWNIDGRLLRYSISSSSFIHYATEAAQTYRIKHKVKTQRLFRTKCSQDRNSIQNTKSRHTDKKEIFKTLRKHKNTRKHLKLQCINASQLPHFLVLFHLFF